MENESDSKANPDEMLSDEARKKIVAKQESGNKAEFRDVHFGKIYDHLSPNQDIDTSFFGGIYLEIDEENLGLERVNLNNLQTAWEKSKDAWIPWFQELGIKMDPFTVFKYYNIQKKAFQLLGKATENEETRRGKQIQIANKVKLSETKNLAMCSEYATLIAYLAQKVGDSAHLIAGSAVRDGRYPIN